MRFHDYFMQYSSELISSVSSISFRPILTASFKIFPDLITFSAYYLLLTFIIYLAISYLLFSISSQAINNFTLLIIINIMIDTVFMLIFPFLLFYFKLNFSDILINANSWVIPYY